MPIVSVCIPQMGEGLQEARLVAVLKQPGDFVKRDEPLYQMETDKAVMDVESPFEGVLTEWLVATDTILPIGSEIAKMDVGGAAETPAAPAPTSAPAPVTSSAAESLISVKIPMMGEGLQEARLVGVLKQPGDHVKRDEPLYQMETDKAVMDVESPFEGVLVEWAAPIDTLLPIGAEIAKMRVAGAVTEDSAPTHQPTAASQPASAPTSIPTTAPGERRTDIPPRTRAYAKEKGLSESQLQTVPAAGSKLMPEDIDRFLSGGATAPAATSAPAAKTTDTYAEQPMSQKQRLLSSRLVRGAQLVVPGTIVVQTVWDGIETLRTEYKESGSEFQPSSFTMFAHCVALALKDFPSFRSTLVGDSTIRTYHTAHLGIAVALPGDELVIAVVDDADTLDFKTFAARTRDQIALARDGKDQANETVTISLTNMQSFGLTDAVAVVAPPSVATLFLGVPFKAINQESDEIELVKVVNLSLTFDHRLINGVGAADFLNKVKEYVEKAREVIPGP